MAVESSSYRQALAEVKRLVARSRSSFSAGMAVLPQQRREAMYGLYAFCRVVDDIADDGATDELRMRGLEAWRQRITGLFQGEAHEAVTIVLLPAIKRYNLIEADFQAIIDGMAMDAGAPICAPDMATLDLYCDRVASAVGRVSVRIFGDDSAEAMKVAAHLGRALQLTNILRDVAEDAARGRLYLPQELLAKHRVSRDPAQVVQDPQLPALCRELAGLARQHFEQADAAMLLCIPAAMKPARIMRAYYGAIFEALVKADWRRPSIRVTLPKWRKIALVLGQMLAPNRAVAL